MTNQTIISQPEKKNFDFIDSIRCISMMFIVFEHSVHVGTYIFNGITTWSVSYMMLIQFAKSGTITFFVLAGFLLGEKFFTYSPREYFQRRVKIIFRPWLFWSLVFVFAMAYKNWIFYRKGPDFNSLDNVLESFKVVYLYSNYWFIINFLICIGILLMFRKYLYSYKFGAILLCLTIFYSINIYLEWVPPMHTMAIFGFIFFLWLGAQLNKNWPVIQAWLSKIPNIIWPLIFGLTFAVSLYEIINLYKIHSTDPYNTLRFSNILYSLVCIAILFRIKDFGFTKYFKPRETTFGIYLIHYIIVFNALPEILRPFHFAEVKNLSIIMMIMLSLLRFIIVYLLTFGLVTLLNRTKLKWIIGR